MTTLEQHPEMEAIFTRLEAVRARHFMVQVATSAAGLLAAVCTVLIVLGLVGGYWPGQPPVWLRWAMLILALAAWAVALGWFVILPIRTRLNYHQTARLVEQHIPGLDNGLINAIQLFGDASQPSPLLVESVIQETARRTKRLPLATVVRTQTLRRWCMAAGGAGVLLLAFALFQGSYLSRGLAAIFHPTSYARQIASVKLTSLVPGDTTVFAGEQLTIVARIENPQRSRYECRVQIVGNGERTMLALTDRTTFTCPLGPAEQSFKYAVWIGDSKFPPDKPYYEIGVLQRVKVEGLDLYYEYPPYTTAALGKANAAVVNANGPIEAPAGTGVKVTLRLSSPVPAVVLETRSGKRLAMKPDTHGRTFSQVLQVLADDAYRIVLTDATGRRLQQLPEVGGLASAALPKQGDANSAEKPTESADAADAGVPSSEMMEGLYPIKAIPDAPPKVAFVEPNRDVAVAPGGKLPLKLKATDDYGLASVKIFLSKEGGSTSPAAAHDFAVAVGKTDADLAWTIELGSEYKKDDVLVYYASAVDNRRLGDLKGQTTDSPRFKIIVQDAAQVAAEKAKRYDQLRARLLAMLEVEEKQRVTTAITSRKAGELMKVRATENQIAGIRTSGKAVADAQTALKADMLDCVDHFPFDSDMVTVQQALAMLANNDATLAITQARVVASVQELAGAPNACHELGQTQDKIIQSLQTLLAILPSLANPDAVKKTSSGEELPPEAKAKLSALKTELEKFVDEQKKVIAASERLAKRPVDNFTPEDEKLLKDLQVAQDQWEKFLNEKFTDFSKLAQQDFSNPAMLKELMSVKTDVTMAKDALKQKAVEIATALEDNGIENAKSLTTNIEKWLPDVADRQKWDMEDPGAQSNTEAPELPKELEDLVGDLLEQEEDLFDEMDDVTGKYAQSGDKGIGWDAMDGPISNMNAQGVTGNQLPNTSEIQGRSGEGRTGKASGEFVEDKAVGKGGRRTPTRLGNEPFQKGEVNDTSGDSAGGATGGGKLSGGGGEGLEGPLAPPLEKELKRLAGKQAQLRNKAERIQAGMKVNDYSNYQMLQAVTLMNRVENDLEANRYQNALRQRQVTIDALKQTKLLLSGKINVTSDTTSNMPKYVKDDIADAMKAKLPPEFRDALQKYFTRLAESGENRQPASGNRQQAEDRQPTTGSRQPQKP